AATGVGAAGGRSRADGAAEAALGAVGGVDAVGAKLVFKESEDGVAGGQGLVDAAVGLARDPGEAGALLEFDEKGLVAAFLGGLEAMTTGLEGCAVGGEDEGDAVMVLGIFAGGVGVAGLAGVEGVADGGGAGEGERVAGEGAAVLLFGEGRALDAALRWGVAQGEAIEVSAVVAGGAGLTGGILGADGGVRVLAVVVVEA